VHTDHRYRPVKQPVGVLQVIMDTPRCFTFAGVVARLAMIQRDGSTKLQAGLDHARTFRVRQTLNWNLEIGSPGSSEGWPNALPPVMGMNTVSGRIVCTTWRAEPGAPRRPPRNLATCLYVEGAARRGGERSDTPTRGHAAFMRSVSRITHRW
jgi:hypothetical protein